MKIQIENLKGKLFTFDLEDVGSVYPDDDVIYFMGEPCRLSTARPAPSELEGDIAALLAMAED